MRHATTIGVVIALALVGCSLEDKDGTGDGDAGVVGPIDVAGVCERVCRRLVIDCQVEPGSELECRDGCAADLVDCAPAELVAIDECRLVACMPGNTDPVLQCITSVGCVGG